MLTIPQEIKDILHLDSAYKNIRIHFPNGERSDICNDLIVKDSVSFTESLCSQNTLKFGLCESPVFECEVVGVGNIKGATIEVYCEVECDSAVEDSVFRNDLQKYVYPIPYGVFVVQECKRQADMQHRKIVAYSVLINEDINQNYLEYCKMYESRDYVTSYNPNAFVLSMINLEVSNFSSEVFSQSHYDPVTSDGTVAFDWYAGQSLNDPRTCKIFFESGAAAFRFGSYMPIPLATINDFYKLSFKDNKSVAESIIDTAYELVCKYGWLNGRSGFLSVRDLMEITLSYRKNQSYHSYYYMNERGESFILLYPWVSNEVEFASIFLRCRATKIQIINDTTSQIIEEKILSEQEGTIRNPNDISLDKYTAIDSELNKYILNYDVLVGRFNYRTFVRPDISNQQILNDILMLTGYFGMISRDHAFELINIKRQFGLDPDSELYPGTSLYPQGVIGGAIYTNDYQTCWYDDDYSKPFGAIRCQYKNTNNDDCEYTYFIDGYDSSTNIDSYLVYEIENNYFIKNNLWTEAQIRTICEAIASNIEGVTYMPVDFVGRGLPYVEAGDTFEILTKSNESITTIVLNRTLTGEQTLTDSYKSV